MLKNLLINTTFRLCITVQCSTEESRRKSQELDHRPAINALEAEQTALRCLGILSFLDVGGSQDFTGYTFSLPSVQAENKNDISEKARQLDDTLNIWGLRYRLVTATLLCSMKPLQQNFSYQFSGTIYKQSMYIRQQIYEYSTNIGQLLTSRNVLRELRPSWRRHGCPRLNFSVYECLSLIYRIQSVICAVWELPYRYVLWHFREIAIVVIFANQLKFLPLRTHDILTHLPPL